MDNQVIKTEQKALEINLNPRIYGTFSEIGAGQEVARNFFQAGAAAGTIAKSMSAYDKTYSDAIYGVEKSNRYVCESRLYKMLDHEWDLLEERLTGVVDANFFVFADTVAAINYHKTIKGNGWLGLRFKLTADGPVNEMVIHVKMLDNDNKLQQEAIGVLGVNMIYACYYYKDNPEKMVNSLIDGLKGRVNVDLIRVKGDDFKHTENRILSLYLVKNGISDLTIIDENKQSVHASEFLYKKSLMVVRGNFKPPTLVTLDVIRSGFEQFIGESYINPEKAVLVLELTMEYMFNSDGRIDDNEFLDRMDLLNSMGYKVIISNCNNHQMMINYMSDYKIKHLGLVLGVRELLEIVTDKYNENQDGRLLVAFGELFTRNIKIYVYPASQPDKEELMDASNMPVPDGIKFLHKHLVDCEQIVPINDYNKQLLSIFPSKVLELIKQGSDEWMSMVPEEVVNIIIEKNIFDFRSKRKEIEAV